jgi:hypothetical protein
MGWHKIEGLYHMVKLVQLRGFSLNSCWLSPDWECSDWVGWGGVRAHWMLPSLLAVDINQVL